MAKATSRSRPSRSTVAVLALLSLTLIAVDTGTNGGATDAVRSGARDVFASLNDAVKSPFGSSAELDRLQQENAALRMELESVRGAANQQGDAQRRLDNLSALLELPTAAGTSKVIAPVTAMESGNFDSTIEIGKGSSDGVKTGMPVVAGEGLVGRVLQTSSRRSTVLLLTDTTSNTAVRVGETGDVAVAVGQGRGDPLRLELIDVDSVVQPGDVVVTSGMHRSVFPPGIPVGKVQSAEAGPQDLRQNVEVTPLASTHRLDNVAVLLWEPPAVDR